MGLFRNATMSVKNYISLVAHGDLKLHRDRIGRKFYVNDGTFKVFMETVNYGVAGGTVVLIIGFRLKLLRSNSILHWLFQRLCIISTPFWSGLPGFKTKLWMVDPATCDYLGIYDWNGLRKAQAYVDFLLPILNFFSVDGSVHARCITDERLQEFLAAHAADGKISNIKTPLPLRI